MQEYRASPRYENNANKARTIDSDFLHALVKGELSTEDKNYIGQLSAQRTGITPAEAEARVTSIFNEVRNAIEETKQAADKARKAAAYTSLWMFVALLCGAFVASISATWGGKQRDSFKFAD